MGMLGRDIIRCGQLSGPVVLRTRVQLPCWQEEWRASYRPPCFGDSNRVW